MIVANVGPTNTGVGVHPDLPPVAIVLLLCPVPSKNPQQQVNLHQPQHIPRHRLIERVLVTELDAAVLDAHETVEAIHPYPRTEASPHSLSGVRARAVIYLLLALEESRDAEQGLCGCGVSPVVQRRGFGRSVPSRIVRLDGPVNPDGGAVAVSVAALLAARYVVLSHGVSLIRTIDRRTVPHLRTCVKPISCRHTDRSIFLPSPVYESPRKRLTAFLVSSP